MKYRVLFLVAVIAGGAVALWHRSPAEAVDQTPGTKFKIDATALAKPSTLASNAFSPKGIAPPSAAPLAVPQGFVVNAFAQKLANPRKLLVVANGDVLMADSGTGRIMLLRDADNDGKAEIITVFADDFAVPYGLVFGNGALYVGDQVGLWRIPYEPGDMKPRTAPLRLTPDGAFGTSGGHGTRNLALAPDGTKIFVAIGSATNIGEEPAPRATVQVFDLSADGTSVGPGRTYATGLRNPVGISFLPNTNDLFVTVNERDGLGDELVPDYFTKITDGAFFGWPYSYIGQNPQPGFADKRPDLVAKAAVPDVLFRSHSAPLGFAFYTGQQFPEAFHNGAFVALHGSWNASSPHGYMIAFVPFADGKPTGGYELFAGGWLADAGKQVWGRPADVAVAKDGSLLIADDFSASVWRISYKAN